MNSYVIVFLALMVKQGGLQLILSFEESHALKNSKLCILYSMELGRLSFFFAFVLEGIVLD